MAHVINLPMFDVVFRAPHHPDPHPAKIDRIVSAIANRALSSLKTILQGVTDIAIKPYYHALSGIVKVYLGIPELIISPQSGLEHIIKGSLELSLFPIYYVIKGTMEVALGIIELQLMPLYAVCVIPLA